jgi:hypothetical protein
MATLQQNSSAYLRSGSPATHEIRGSFGPEARPYLVTATHRKTAKSTQQYLALFPHESEDARLTGATRSLYRRLLALNLRQDKTSGETSVVSSETILSGTRIA